MWGKTGKSCDINKSRNIKAFPLPLPPTHTYAHIKHLFLFFLVTERNAAIHLQTLNSALPVNKANVIGCKPRQKHQHWRSRGRKNLLRVVPLPGPSRSSSCSRALCFNGLNTTSPPPSHHAGAVASSHRVGRGPHRFGRRVLALPTPPVLGVGWRLLSSRIGSAVPNDDFRVQSLWGVFWIYSTGVIRLSRGVQMRRVAVHAWFFVVDVFVETGRGEAAGFDDGSDVDGGDGVGSEDEAVFADLLRCLNRSRFVTRERGYPWVSCVTLVVTGRPLSDARGPVAEVDVGRETINLLNHLNDKIKGGCYQTAFTTPYSHI